MAQPKPPAPPRGDLPDRGDPPDKPFRPSWPEVCIFAIGVALLVFLILHGNDEWGAVTLVVTLVGALFSALLWPRAFAKAVKGLVSLAKSVGDVGKELRETHRRVKEREQNGSEPPVEESDS